MGRALRGQEPAIRRVISDIYMPDVDGLQLVKERVWLALLADHPDDAQGSLDSGPGR